ncbi:MAG: GDSL-type esterase/lipase family protein [Candidatus Bathyarchaeia archaeon]|jgi:lysophospholipase L1-like esterase
MKQAKVKVATILIMLILAISSLIIIIQLNSQTQIAAQVIRVACIGDSITEWSNYPQELQEMLGDGYVVGNFGVAGSAVTKNSDIPYMNQSAFQEAKEFQPDVVVIMLGTNDAKDFNFRYIYRFVDDYQELVNSYDTLPDDQEIFLVTPPPIYDNTLGLDNSYLEEGIIPNIEQIADDLDLPTIDVNSVMTDHSDYFKDGVHPNDEGAEVIANTINGAITQNDFLTPDMLEVYQYLLES